MTNHHLLRFSEHVKFVKKQNSLAYPIKKRDIYIQPTLNHQTYIEYLMHVKHAGRIKKIALAMEKF